MSNEHRNYKEFKNLIHNELGITKEEIRELIKEAVTNEVSWLVNDRRDYIDGRIDVYIGVHIKSLIDKALTTNRGLFRHDSIQDNVKSALKNEITKTLLSDLEISFDIKKKNSCIVDNRSDFERRMDGDM
jgi:hypothetical protein